MLPLHCLNGYRNSSSIAVVIILQIITVSQTSEIPLDVVCPANCTCPQVQKAVCEHGSEIPKEFDPNITYIKLSNIRTPNLQDITLDKGNLQNVMHLEIKFCEVQNISINAFSEMNELISLDLSHNNIKVLLKNTFKGNVKLMILTLDSNPLTTSSEVFLSSDSIISLSMVNCGIQNIPSTFFRELPELTELHLNKNRMEYLSMETFCNIKRLEILNLEQNNWKCNADLRPLITWYLLTFKDCPLCPDCSEPCKLLWNKSLAYIFPTPKRENINLTAHNQTRNIVIYPTLTAVLENAIEGFKNIIKEETEPLKNKIDSFRIIWILFLVSFVIIIIITASISLYFREHLQCCSTIFNNRQKASINNVDIRNPLYLGRDPIDETNPLNRQENLLN